MNGGSRDRNFISGKQVSNIIVPIETEIGMKATWGGKVRLCLFKIPCHQPIHTTSCN
jgi:hypothetical protein